ncbi:avidin-like [Paroedura picta]|uniref:avidin-like n=1 Tax=Paroedura picta TaxID=143630 RepID=UPI0010142D9F
MERWSLTPPLALLCSIFSGGRLLPVVEAAAKPRQAALTGTWQNELGSTMVLGAPDAAGAFRGTYKTAVAASKKPIQESPLFGTQHLADHLEQPTFGFAVNWTFSDSTAVFVGQHFVDAKGKETLETTWLLREQAESRGEDWKATRVGRNIFTRVE